ncbi:DUF6233 domain-containing protein [Streptomyces sp. NBC_01477]|uniref:DUF6233 domain-containing protein n=1 Tax=Streptomyces sp. NBC_01477 TaxID=2976015 RepID=UPI003FCDD8AB
MPTERYGVPARWRIEESVYFGTTVGPARIVHRGTCHANHDYARPATTEQARAVLERADAAACQVCRPDRPAACVSGSVGAALRRGAQRSVTARHCGRPTRTGNARLGQLRWRRREDPMRVGVADHRAACTRLP